MSPPTQDRRSPPRRKRKPLIYIVDDESLLLDLAEVSLQTERYTIRKFQDPEVALTTFLAAKLKPDLLITDYAMGKMNGLELLERCKRAHAELRTVLVSGTAGAEIVLGAPLKIDRFLGKPYPPAGLRDLVKAVLEQ